MFELVDSTPESAIIRVIGVGGGGGNAVQHMLKHHVDGVDFVAANTDAQALKNVNANTILQLGASVTQGLGAGANPGDRETVGPRGPGTDRRDSRRRGHGLHYRRNGRRHRARARRLSSRKWPGNSTS